MCQSALTVIPFRGDDVGGGIHKLSADQVLVLRLNWVKEVMPNSGRPPPHRGAIKCRYRSHTPNLLELPRVFLYVVPEPFHDIVFNLPNPFARQPELAPRLLEGVGLSVQ